METDILNPKSLFQKDIRYTVPEFQRTYVWEQEDQWEPLWDDVRNIAENYLDEFQRRGNSVEAEQNTPHHFLGAVVLQQVPTASRNIERREVIDGQQRLTTLQLLLDAVQLVCEELELKSEARRLSKLVTNDEDIAAGEDEVFKLWPSRSDREAFRHAMHNGLATDDFETSLIVQAHEFFQLQTKEWLASNSTPIDQRVEALETAVTGMLQVVVIDLKTEDDPNVIFETLNARGTPLLESELIKNYVVSRSNQPAQGESNIWGDFDDTWWRNEVRQGRLYRPRIDVMLNYWLMARTVSEVPASRVFNVFRSSSDSFSILDVMSDVKRDLGNYRHFETGSRTPEEDAFHYRTGVMQMGAITPALLILLAAPLEQRIRALKALESFLVRRMVCRGSTKDYNNLTLTLVEELREGDLTDVDKVVVRSLRSQTAESREWPDDGSLLHAIETLPLYRLLTRGRLRLILEGVEERLREISLAETSDVPKNLTIEHVMPQSWRDNWPLPDVVDELEASINRNRLVHTVGNLTLVSGRLNSTLSNDPWKQKRHTLWKHTNLSLNKLLLDEWWDAEWDELAIQARAKQVAHLFTAVWPGPDSEVWDE